MNLRADHLAGAAFAGFGLVVLAYSGELPFGRLSMPGAGFMPKILAWLLIGLGIALALRARENQLLAEIGWDDLGHAAVIILICSVAVFFYTTLGFIITMFLMIFALLVLLERRDIQFAGAYGLVVVGFTYILFYKFLRAPPLPGPFGF